jgi:hypothetical protein
MLMLYHSHQHKQEQQQWQQLLMLQHHHHHHHHHQQQQLQLLMLQHHHQQQQLLMLLLQAFSPQHWQLACKMMHGMTIMSLPLPLQQQCSVRRGHPNCLVSLQLMVTMSTVQQRQEMQATQGSQKQRTS